MPSPSPDPLQAIAERQRKLDKLAREMDARAKQNRAVAGHLVTLGRVLEDQKHLGASLQSGTDAGARRMRSMVTHKKLKEIAGAQADELAALHAELDAARSRAYPLFGAAPHGAMGMSGSPARAPPDARIPAVASTGSRH